MLACSPVSQVQQLHTQPIEIRVLPRTCPDGVGNQLTFRYDYFFLAIGLAQRLARFSVG